MPVPLIVGVAVRLGIAAAGKIIAKRAATAAAKKAAEVAAKRAAEEAARKAAAQGLSRHAGTAATRDAAKRAAQESLKKSAPQAGGKGRGNTAGKHKAKKSNRKGPCDHLKGGDSNGRGPYRGGAHGSTKKPSNDGLDSHHIPAKDSSPVGKNSGPAIKMDPKDHAKTASNGQMAGSVDYREAIAELIAAGRWRDAMAIELRDVRRVAREAGDPRKYNEAIREALDYFHCLKANSLLK